MSKTGARLLGMFLASLIAWLWKGWGEPATGVPMDEAFIAALGGACIVLTEWALVNDGKAGEPAPEPARPVMEETKQ